MANIDISQFTLSFDDEFESLDLQSNNGTWRTSYYDGDGGRTHGDELQIYVDYSYLGLNINPFSITDGILSIHAQTATPEMTAATGYDYTSGMLSSSGAFSQTYGYFEIKCDTPEAAGTWPAFWLLPANGSWPPELDVFEALGSDTSKVYTTVHSAQTGEHVMTGISAAIPDQSDGMHTYGVLWTKDELVWYIDGQEVYRTATPDDMHQPMYMVTNLAVGGWAGDPGADFQGADYKIDYIRAYTLDSTPYPNIVESDHNFVLDKVANGLILTGTADINGTGNTLDNTLTGNSANNVLDGGLGADAMAGGAGNDIYYVDNNGDTVTEDASAGTDKIMSSVNLALAANIENLVLTGTADLNGTGNDLANSLTGNSGNNILDGGLGADIMTGGDGNDTYYVDNSGDVVSDWSGQGTDTVISSISYALVANVENLTLTGTANINATGNWGDNVLTGNAGNNVLDGSGGTDSMSGGLGDDTYYVESTGDTVTEWYGQGTDTVVSSLASYTLSANVEKLVLASPWTSNGTGNALDNTLIGSAAANVLDGGTGADTMTGGAGNDTYYVDGTGDVVTEWSSAGCDTVSTSLSSYTLGANVEKLMLTSAWSANGYGNALNNTLTGNAAANILDGGAGVDTMIGGAGDDTYYVDDSGDVITEWSSQGTDKVFSSASLTLAANVENLTLTGSSDLNGTGNELANTLTGNSGSNNLDGGAGADTLVGGYGNDSYYVDNSGDVVTEWYNQGTDTVFSAVSYKLGSNIENLTLTGTVTINAAGNELNNVLTGNSGNNILDGGTGSDAMAGGLGNDTYYVDNSGDTVTESASAGCDTVSTSLSSYTLGANVEKLVLTSAWSANGYGNALINTLTGNAAANILDGGTGADAMIGGAGDDTYYVDNSGDTITEWSSQGTDKPMSKT